MATETDTPIDDGLQAVMGSRATIVDDNVDEQGEQSTDTQNKASDTPDNTDSGDESRKYAGRYESVEDLEKGYKSILAEYTRSQQALRDMQAATSDTGKTNESNELDPEIRAQIDPYLREATAPLEAQLAEQQQKGFWKEMESEYGAGISDKVAEYFQKLPADEQNQLDSIAGARMIAKLVGQQSRKPDNSAASQPTGGVRSHNAPRSTLTRAAINAMSPEEYARRQPEIMRFYSAQT